STITLPHPCGEFASCHKCGGPKTDPYSPPDRSILSSRLIHALLPEGGTENSPGRGPGKSIPWEALAPEGRDECLRMLGAPSFPRTSRKGWETINPTISAFPLSFAPFTIFSLFTRRAS